MGLTYVIPDIITSYLSWRKIQKCFKSTSRTAFKDSNSLDPFVLFTLLATVSYTSDSPLQLVSGFTIIAIHWSVSPTPTLVLDKLLFLQILDIFNFKAIDSSSSEGVQHFEDNQFYFKTIKKAFNTGDWLESTGKWTLLWISKEVPAPGRCHLVMVKPKSGDRLTAWKC